MACSGLYSFSPEIPTSWKAPQTLPNQDTLWTEVVIVFAFPDLMSNENMTNQLGGNTSQRNAWHMCDCAQIFHLM